MSTIHGSLAFIFNKDLTEVLLIRKQKPVSHAGLLNGLGGKQEKGESAVECVVREVEEEAGLQIAADQWLMVGQIEWSNWRVDIWTAQLKDVSPATFIDSNVGWYPVNNLPADVIENLLWLIPLSRNCIRNTAEKVEVPQVTVRYQ